MNMLDVYLLHMQIFSREQATLYQDLSVDRTISQPVGLLARPLRVFF